MKKKHFATLVVFMLISLFAVSCQPKDDDEPEEATLSLSTRTLVMDNQAQTPSAPQITFQTNQSKVFVSAQADWLDASIKGNGILITAMANDQGHDRKANVFVLAGSAIEQITVTQSAADIVLEVSPESKTVPNTGEILFVSVKSNSNSWTVEPSGFDWIQVEKFTSETLKVTVLPNESVDSREGQLYAKSGTISKQINIKQVGIGSSKFVLPLLKRDPSQFEILSYEKRQGNLFVSFVAPYPEYGMYDEVYTFACSSPVISQIIYTKNILKNAVTKIVMLSNDAQSLKSLEFKDFLKENGFEIGNVGVNGNFNATHSESNFMVSVKISADASKLSTLEFIPIVKQPKKYPTFKKFPLDRSDVLKNPSWPTSAIIEMEKAENSVVTPEYSEKYPDLMVRIKCELADSSDRDVPILRTYFISIDDKEGTTTDLSDEIMTIWEDYHLGAWADGNSFVMTNEFLTLLSSAGFEFFTESNGNKYYFNKDTKLMVVPRGARFADVKDGAPVFAISYFIYDKGTNSMSDPIMKNMLIDKLDKRVAAQDARLNSRKQ